MVDQQSRHQAARIPPRAVRWAAALPAAAAWTCCLVGVAAAATIGFNAIDAWARRAYVAGLREQRSNGIFVGDPAAARSEQGGGP